jgi:SAM-dependent methyltransferase
VVADLADAKRAIAQDYGTSAVDYARHAEPLIYRRVARPLAKAISHVEGPVLDVASGTGALARQLREVVATDLVHSQLLHNPVARRVQADAERLPFRDDSFAAAVSAFGVNHFPDPHSAVAEMARLAPVVGVLTWRRPDVPYLPKEIVLKVIADLAGRARTRAGEVIEELSLAVGSPRAVRAMLASASLRPEVRVVETELPWPGTQAFIDYRLVMCGMASIIDAEVVRREAAAQIDELPRTALTWRPRLVLGLGRRPG